jgi:NTP pyrophosphatase (non-canonical NTP hydrolase)
MNIDKFRGIVRRTWNTALPHDERKTHAVLTLTTEAAEVADIWKKAKFSNRPDKAPGIDMVHLAEEIGDAAYGLIAVCEEFGVDLEYCLDVTARKLEKRYDS